MTKYICKCGRVVAKSTSADNTGNRDTENCKGCPYLLPWGPTQWDAARHAMVTDVKGYECRMSKVIEYATRFCGSIDDKCSCYIASLDFDFLTMVSNWIKETYPGGELNGSFFTDDIRAYVSNGRYRMSISCAQNKKGIAAKAALLHRFFDASGARLDMTPEEEKIHILAAIEAGKAQAQKKEDKTLMYKDPVTGWLYRVSPNPINDKGLYELEYLDQQNSTIWKPDVYWNTNAVYRDQEHLQEALDNRARRDGWESVEKVPVENPTDAAEDVQQCVPTASDAPLSQSQSVNADAQQGDGDDAANPTYSAVATAVTEGTVDTPEPLDSASMTAVPAAKTNAEVVDATNKVAASSNLPDVCRDCQCATCGNKGCASPCWENPREVGDCEITGPAGDACRDYRPKEDVQCQKENAPSADAAATSDESAVRMCEGSDEETRTTPVAASGAALESLHAQAVLPQNAPAQDIAADAPSAQAFDYSGLDAETAERLQNLARRAMEAKQRYVLDLMEVVTEAHRKLVARCDKQNNQHSENTFRAWCASIGVGKDTAYRLLQVQALMDGSTPEEQEALADAPVKLLYAAAKPSAPAELVQAVKDGDITTHKQFKELEAKLKAEREAREKAEREAEDFKKRSEDAHKAANTYHCQYEEANAQKNALLDKQGAYIYQVTAAEQRAEEAERRARAAEEDAAGWKQAGLEMQELVDQRDERIRELESGITVETTAADQEEIERRANELSEPLVKIIDQQNEQIERMASGNTVAAQASVLEQYLRTMQTSLLSNAQRAELAFYDVGALDSLAGALREFADEIDGLFEEGEENEE